MLFSKHKTITATDTETIFEVPTGYTAHWNLTFISNHGGSTNNVSLWMDNDRDGDGTYTTQFYIIDGKQLGSTEYLQFSDGVVVLHSGDRVRASIGSAGDVAVIITFDLLYSGIDFADFNQV